AYIESLVYLVRPDGSKQLQSGMYILPLGSGFGSIPAEYSSELTPWHVHTNLCWGYGPDGSLVLKGLSRDGVNCPAGSFYCPTPPMLHVWIVPTPCGPFAEV